MCTILDKPKGAGTKACEGCGEEIPDNAELRIMREGAKNYDPTIAEQEENDCDDWENHPLI